MDVVAAPDKGPRLRRGLSTSASDPGLPTALPLIRSASTGAALLAEAKPQARDKPSRARTPATPHTPHTPQWADGFARGKPMRDEGLGTPRAPQTPLTPRTRVSGGASEAPPVRLGVSSGPGTDEKPRRRRRAPSDVRAARRSSTGGQPAHDAVTEADARTREVLAAFKQKPVERWMHWPWIPPPPPPEPLPWKRKVRAKMQPPARCEPCWSDSCTERTINLGWKDLAEDAPDEQLGRLRCDPNPRRMAAPPR
eukprot:6208146-Prymnesium_polylepis.1